METRANFALIGAFALAGGFAAFAFVYWFSGPSHVGKQETFQIVFEGSVSGLTRGSSVLFNGVKVGEVTRLGISESDPSKVDVLVNIDSRTPVKTDTRARLETRGFTGVSDVLLVGGTQRAPNLTAQEDARFPQIRAERSEIQNLLGNVQSLSTKAADVLAKLDKLLDENSGTITATLNNTEVFTRTLADNSANISTFMKDAAEVAHSLKPVAQRLDKVLATGELAIKALDPRKLKQITTDIAGAAGNINRFSTNGLRQYESLATDGRKTVDTLDQTLRAIGKDPSQFIFGPAQSVPEYQGR